MAPQIYTFDAWHEPAPTDQPVLGRFWYAMRSIVPGQWQCDLMAADAPHPRLVHMTAVVDDFGALVPIDDAGRWKAYHWAEGEHLEPAAWLWREQHDALLDAQIARSRAERRAADLARPPPVTVEIQTEPIDLMCVASIVLGPDPRVDSPHYSVHAPGQDPLWLSHAQLAALMLDAQQICKAAKPQGRLQ